MDQNLYSILGVPPQASLDQIKQSYKRRIKEAHPDSGGDPVEAARINWAYAVLSDPEQRWAYDTSVHSLVKDTFTWVRLPVVDSDRWMRMAVWWLATAGLLWLCLKPVDLPAMMLMAMR